MPDRSQIWDGTKWVPMTGSGVGPMGPKGLKGDTGDPGIHGIAGTDGTDSTVQGPKGDTGAPGAASVVAGPDGHIGPVGPAGHSVHILSTVPTATDLPTGAGDGDAHLVVATGDLMVWSDHSNDWIDLGHIAGPVGGAGPQGPRGLPGSDGTSVKGDPGDPGAPGATGPGLTLSGEYSASTLNSLASMFDQSHKGHGYTVTTGGTVTGTHIDAGHLVVWDGTKFIDAGMFVGPMGPKGDQGDPAPATKSYETIVFSWPGQIKSGYGKGIFIAQYTGRVIRIQAAIGTAPSNHGISLICEVGASSKNLSIGTGQHHSGPVTTALVLVEGAELKVKVTNAGTPTGEDLTVMFLVEKI